MGIGLNFLSIKIHLSRGKVARDHPLSGSRVRGQAGVAARVEGLNLTFPFFHDFRSFAIDKIMVIYI
jgi:hypothetical protein